MTVSFALPHSLSKTLIGRELMKWSLYAGWPLKPTLNDVAADVICLQEVELRSRPLMEDAGSLLLIVFSAIRLTKVTTARRAFGLERTRQRISIISRS
jgi:hypothetical protein